MANLHDLTLLDQLGLLRSGGVSPLELTRHYLDRIDRHDAEIGAFVTVTADAALARARALEVDGGDARDRGPLWGLPLADKDLVNRAGVPSGFGSRLFAGWVPDTSDDAALLLDEAGSVSLGKTNTSEFGLAGYTEPIAHVPARSPWQHDIGAGGSSGGAAAAVSAGLLPAAIGSDGGGSVRLPAAATGLVGVKPSRGRVPSGSGFLSLAGMAVHGPLARTVADAALLLDVMTRGRDARFATRPDGAAPFLDERAAERRFTIATTTTSPWDDWTDIVVDQRVRRVLDETVAAFTGIGHIVEGVELRDTAAYPQAFHTVWQSGASAIPAEGAQLDQLEPLTRWLVQAGRGRTARELAEALRRLGEFERDLIAQLAPWDALLTPTLAVLPRPVGWYDPDDGERNFEQQVRVMPYTSMANVAGLPAISLPVAMVDGLPVGMQLIGRPGGESALLAIAAQLEAQIGWQHRHPPQW